MLTVVVCYGVYRSWQFEFTQIQASENSVNPFDIRKTNCPLIVVVSMKTNGVKMCDAARNRNQSSFETRSDNKKLPVKTRSDNKNYYWNSMD